MNTQSRFTFILCLLISLCASPLLRAESPPPQAFCDVPWDTPIEETKRILAQKTDMRLTKESPTKLIYIGGSFAQIRAERWEFDFLDGGFYRGTVCLSIPTGAALDGTALHDYQFEDLAGLFTAKYGKGKREDPPDIVKETWVFPNNKEDHGYSILLNFHWKARQQFYVQYMHTRKVQTNPTDALPKGI